LIEAGKGRCKQLAGWDFIRVECVDVPNEKMVVLRPVGAIHFRLFGIDIVGENDVPSFAFERQATRLMPAKNSAARKGRPGVSSETESRNLFSVIFSSDKRVPGVTSWNS
jgi:hypothetical protein